LDLEVVSAGVRADILPGGTKAKKADPANLIARPEETAAMCSQAGTAKLLAGNPTSMRFRGEEVTTDMALRAALKTDLKSTQNP